MTMVRPMTEDNLISAFAGESQAHMRYTLYSVRAEKNFPNVSRLFKAVAFAERIHARNHYRNIQHLGDYKTVSMALFGNQNTSMDLKNGIDGEMFEVNEMYPSYMELAKIQEEPAAEITFRYAWEAEKTHAAFYQRAKASVDENMDLELEQMGVCDVCGYTVEGEPPERCPICNAKKERFVLFP
jgi:rubrerythrin